jgi:hypothetical protein
MGVTHLMGGLPFHEGRVTTTMNRRKGRGWPHPSWAVAPSPIYMLDMLLFMSYTLSLSSPTLLLHYGGCLSEALPKFLATNTWRSGRGGGVPVDPYLRSPAGPRAWRTSPNRTCDRVRRRHRLWHLVHDLEILKGMTMLTTYIFIKSSSATFVRERKIPLPIFEG